MLQRVYQWKVTLTIEKAALDNQYTIILEQLNSLAANTEAFQTIPTQTPVENKNSCDESIKTKPYQDLLDSPSPPPTPIHRSNPTWQSSDATLNRDDIMSENWQVDNEKPSFATDPLTQWVHHHRETASSRSSKQPHKATEAPYPEKEMTSLKHQTAGEQSGTWR